MTPIWQGRAFIQRRWRVDQTRNGQAKWSVVRSPLSVARAQVRDAFGLHRGGALIQSCG